MRSIVLFVLVAVIGLLLGLGLAWWMRPVEPPTPSGGVVVGDFQPGFRHADLNGQWVTDQDFSGRALLVNFWATWCAPCRREMPVLQGFSEQHAERIAVVGIAVDEPVPVQQYIDELGIDYAILVGSADVLATQRAWGNRSGALPYTVLVDRSGVIRWQHLGEVSERQLNQAIGALQDGP